MCTLETIEDDETTGLGNTSIPDMNLLSHSSGTAKKENNAQCNCTELLLENTNKLGKVSETDKTSDNDQDQLGDYTPDPE